MLKRHVLERPRALFHQTLAAWVTLITRRPGMIALVAAALTASALVYTARHLAIDTSTTEMIDAEVPFRQHDIAFKRAFPRFAAPLVAVIEADAPEQAAAAAAALADALSEDNTHFSAVRYVAGDPFFRTHGLLFRTPEELAELADRLAEAQPLLAVLAEDPSLRGLDRFVSLTREQGGAGATPPELDRLFARMAEVTRTQLEGRPGSVSWRRLLDGSDDQSPAREIVLAQPRLDHTSLAPAASAIAAARALAQELGITPEQGLRLRLTGPAALDHEELESVASGAALAGALTLVAVAGLLIWGLRSARLIAATLLTLAAGLILTAALAALTIGRLNLISVTFAILFVGLGVDFGIHLTLRYREALAGGASLQGALRSAVAGVGGPLSLSALCATLGFLAFVPTDYRGLAELGIISAFGMAIAWFASLTLLPALLCLMPLRRVPSSPEPGVAGERATWHRLRHHLGRPLLALAVLAALASAAALPQLRFDFNPLHLKDPETESVATFLELSRDGAAPVFGIEVVAPDLAEAQATAARLEESPLVEEAVTLASFVPGEQDEKLELIDAMAFYLGPVLENEVAAPDLSAEQYRQSLRSIQESLAGVAGAGAAAFRQALIDFLERRAARPEALADLEERLMGSLPRLIEQLSDALKAGPVALDSLPESVRRDWIGAGGQARVLVQPAVPITDNDSLRAFASAALEQVPSATGTPIIISEAGRAVVEAFTLASVLALAAITVLLSLIFHHLRDVLLVLAPLGLAVLLTAASAVLLDLDLNFANVIVLPLLLGLGVSGAIHVVVRRRQEGDESRMMRSSTPRAVLFSALTTIASFGSLAVSSHRGLASMGALLTIAILWSLVCTLLVLPALLSAGRSRATGRGS